MSLSIIAELHSHTISSDHAFSTVKEMVDTAASLKLSAIAITDHAPATADSAHRWHFGSMHVFPHTVSGTRLLRGAELNILNSAGVVDLCDDTLKKLDFVIASIHKTCFTSTGENANTEAYLNALKNPYIDLLGHPGSSTFPFDVDAVAEACAKAGRAMEINAHAMRAAEDSDASSWGARVFESIARACMRHNTWICVDADAHICYSVANVQNALDLLERIGFPEGQILNANAKRLAKWLKARKGREVL